MYKVMVRAVGNSMGFILPKEAIAHLKVKNGDALYLTDSPEGCLLTPYDPEFARQMEIAESVMRRDRDALKQLAK